MTTPSSGRRRWWVAARWLAAAVFLIACARVYDPLTGFTSFIRFQANGTERDLLPAVKAVPHAEFPGGYDGQFYAQLALDPLLRDPAMDLALDLPSYRARRILFSWTAYVIGMGRPAWILQVFAVQNIVTWLIFAWVIGLVIPQTSARAFALWLGCVFAHGMLASVWLALTDGPSLLLLTLAVVAAERERPVVAALVLGLAGLARETSLIGAGLFVKFIRPRSRSWWLVAACLVIAILPLALWMDYLRSIYYNHGGLAGSDHVTPPLQGLLWKLRAVRREWHRDGLTISTLSNFTALTGLVVQSGVVAWLAIRRDWRSPWVMVGLSFVIVAVLAKAAVWEGSPGAFTRAVLPLTIAVNVLLSREPRASWWLIATANLGVLPGLLVMS